MIGCQRGTALSRGSLSHISVGGQSVGGKAYLIFLTFSSIGRNVHSLKRNLAK